MKHRNRPIDRLVRRSGSAFTLAELLVVILIMVILMLVAVPAFAALLYSSESSMAETLLRAALRSGRDAAIRSTGHDDAAIVFFFEPGGRCTMVPCVKAGELEDVRDDGSTINREVFVASDVLEPVQLPKNWTVRGYAPLNSIDESWYEPAGMRYGMVDPARPQVGDWVFPETGFYYSYTTSWSVWGQDRQTFMVRFEAGTGLMSTASSRPVLVFAPAVVEPQVMSNVPASFRTLRKDNPRRYVERVLTDTFTGNSPAARELKMQKLLGDQSVDTVLTRAVSEIALCDENKLASALGVRVDPTTRCLYQPWRTMPGRDLSFVPGVTSSLINRWIEGDTNLNGVYEQRVLPSGMPGDSPEARIYTIDRYTGVLREVEVQR